MGLLADYGFPQFFPYSYYNTIRHILSRVLQEYLYIIYIKIIYTIIIYLIYICNVTCRNACKKETPDKRELPQSRDGICP